MPVCSATKMASKTLFVVGFEMEVEVIPAREGTGAGRALERVLSRFNMALLMSSKMGYLAVNLRCI